MSICLSESTFGDDMRENYTPHQVETRLVRTLRDVVCLALFAAIGAMLAACGGGGEHEDDTRAGINPPNCAQEVCR